MIFFHADLQPYVAESMLPGLPAYIIFMCIRHTDHINDDEKVCALLTGVVNGIKRVVKVRGGTTFSFQIFFFFHKNLADKFLKSYISCNCLYLVILLRWGFLIWELILLFIADFLSSSSYFFFVVSSSLRFGQITRLSIPIQGRG